MISIIIPTHNRAELLHDCLVSIEKLVSQVSYEVIVVDNNSSDDTKQITGEFDFARYVFEPSTAFTKARNTGADKARGDILLFLDDDATLQGSSLDLVELIFETVLNCGVIAGRIEPKFSKIPPKNLIKCQKTHNAWSLFNKETYPNLFAKAKLNPIFIDESKKFYKINAACGPCMAIRKETYIDVGGFPPDTIGVESNNKNYFKKWYIGPGDSGLVKKVINKGQNVLYCDDIWVKHEVSEYRFTNEFWFSRYFGEGTCEVFTHLAFEEKTDKEKNLFRRKLINRYLYSFMMITISQLWRKRIGINKNSLNLLESFISLITLHIFKENDEAVKTIWKAGELGINDSEIREFLSNIPKDWLKLLDHSYATHQIANMNVLNLVQFQKKLISDIFSQNLSYYRIVLKIIS